MRPPRLREGLARLQARAWPRAVQWHSLIQRRPPPPTAPFHSLRPGLASRDIAISHRARLLVDDHQTASAVQARRSDSNVAGVQAAPVAAAGGRRLLAGHKAPAEPGVRPRWWWWLWRRRPWWPQRQRQRCGRWPWQLKRAAAAAAAAPAGAAAGRGRDTVLRAGSSRHLSAAAAPTAHTLWCWAQRARGE